MDIRIAHIEIFHYRIPFSFPITTSGKYQRSGLLLFLYDKDGSYGMGEISPLKSLSRETLTDSLKQLINVSERIKESGIESINISRLYPSIRFGIESAILTLNANKGKAPLWKGFCAKKQSKERTIVKINALISNMDELPGLINNGYTSFKIKVKSIEDIALIDKIRQICGNEAEIIVDANKSFSAEEGIRFGKMVYPLNIKYIEDPIYETYNLKAFFEKTGIGIGIDQDIGIPHIRDREYVRAWIIKPGIACGLKQSIYLINEALGRGIIPVLSNPFYSGVGVSMLILMAYALIPENIPMGLDPYRWIREDILEKPFIIKDGGFLSEDVLMKMGKIKRDMLKMVYQWKQ